MRHLILFLYIVSLMTGIGTITLASFLYIKIKTENLKHFILGDLFFTLYLFLDISSYYGDIINSDSVIFRILVMTCVFAASIGVVYYFAQLTYGFIGCEISKRSKKYFLFISISLVAVFVCILIIAFFKGFIGKDLFEHSIFFYASFYAAVGGCYTVYLLGRNMKKIAPEVRPGVIGCMLVLAVSLPFAVTLNIIEFKVDFEFPTALSPVQYFLINSIILFHARKYYLDNMIIGSSKDRKITETSITPALHYGELSETYGLTEREYEILLFVIEGLNNKEIGEKLFISHNTVRNHIYSAYKKIGVKSRIELINVLVPIHTTPNK